jgi:hypothetical protein
LTHGEDHRARRLRCIRRGQVCPLGSHWHKSFAYGYHSISEICDLMGLGGRTVLHNAEGAGRMCSIWITQLRCTTMRSPETARPGAGILLERKTAQVDNIFEVLESSSSVHWLTESEMPCVDTWCILQCFAVHPAECEQGSFQS